MCYTIGDLTRILLLRDLKLELMEPSYRIPYFDPELSSIRQLQLACGDSYSSTREADRFVQ